MKIKGHIHGIRLSNQDGAPQMNYIKLSEKCELGKEGEIVMVSKVEKDGDGLKVKK